VYIGVSQLPCGKSTGYFPGERHAGGITQGQELVRDTKRQAFARMQLETRRTITRLENSTLAVTLNHYRLRREMPYFLVDNCFAFTI